MILLDTHIWLRWLNREPALPKAILQRIQQESELAISAITCWEVAYLAKRGQIELSMQPSAWIARALAPDTMTRCIPLTQDIACRAALLPEHHRDPADRFIIATALELGAELVSLDAKFPLYEELQGYLFSGSVSP